MPFIQTRDRTSLYYNDWGKGRPVVFVNSAWLNSQMWEFQMPALVEQGLRCVAYDRRGHGRSDWPWDGYDYDTLADDLATLLEQLDLRDVTLVGHSMGGGEIVRYLSRHGASRVARIALIAPTAPFIMATEDNDGIDRSAIEAVAALRAKDRPKWMADNAGSFFGLGLPGVAVSPELVEWTRWQCVQCSPRASHAAFLAAATTDLRAEMRAITVPTLIVHGDHDEQAPIQLCGQRCARLVPGARLVTYENAAHALILTHAERLNRDLLAFING